MNSGEQMCCFLSEEMLFEFFSHMGPCLRKKKKKKKNGKIQKIVNLVIL